MLLLHEAARTTEYITVYRDSDDPRLFFYIPQFAEIASRNDGTLNFGAVLFRKNPNDPNDGYSLYNFGVRGVYPSHELARVKSELEGEMGAPVALQPINPSVAAPSLQPLTDGIYRSIKCQLNGGNLYTDLAASFSVDESLEPDFARLFQTAVGWAGTINYKVLTRRTSFKWEVEANWRQVHEHFRTQTSVKVWFVRANFSYEVQKLEQEGKLTIRTTGGTPEQREKVFAIAEGIAARMFKPALAMNPLPDHPSGAAVGLSVNFSKTFEDKKDTWKGEVNDFEEKELGMAAYVREVPSRYFVNFGPTPMVGVGPMVDVGATGKQLMVNLDSGDSHSLEGWWDTLRTGLQAEKRD